MNNIKQIISDLQTYIGKSFETVRVSAVQNQEQFFKELKAVNPDKLPAVIIVFDNLIYQSSDAVKEMSLTLVLVDRFQASSSSKAMSLYAAVDKLLGLFPDGGLVLGETFIIPTDCAAASPDVQFAALALGITCKQSF